ncbi:MAG TPA: hypothetical protein VNP98_14290 [Chthoniobacterales bacterium]|nr:hypothetical protein [Chthoniobacterales bacterium]
MAWRLHEHVLRGEIDNRARGRVAGRIWLAGVEEPLVLQLLGDCHPDLAGCLLRFENPKPVAMTTKPPALRQRGTVGDITAARRVRVFKIPFEEAYAMIKAGRTPPEHRANALYLEWHADLSGHVVIESTGYRLEVSEPAWRFTAEELAERERRAAEESSNTFAVEIRADGTEEEWDEFRCEELLRESDARGDKYRHLLEKYLDHPDRDRIIAHEMGWTWIEEALDEKAETASSQENDDELSEQEDFVAIGIELPAPEPSREGIDWVRNERGGIVHPIEKRATDALYALLDDLRSAGNPEERHAGLGEFLAHTMTLSGKLAGALGSLARGWDGCESGLTIASLKRALDVLHHALSAAGALGVDTPFPAARIAHFRDELFAIREDMLELMAQLRER